MTGAAKLSPKDVETQIAELIAETQGDPLAFVMVAFPWGEGELEKFDGPDKWQADVLNDIRDGLITIDEAIQIATASGHGIGKAQPKSLVVDTPTGPVRWGDLQPGDLLFGKNGLPTRILVRHEQGIRPIYRVKFSDGSETFADAEHLWSVRGRQHRRKGLKGWSEMTTQEILEAGVLRLNGKAQAAQWEIPQQEAVAYPHRDQPISPYVLGAWLGDGAKASGRITNADSEVWSTIEETDALGPLDARGLCRSVLGLQARLRDLGLLGAATDEVRVPARYKHTNERDRLSMLQALLDTDGWVEGNGQASFCSTSFGLVEDVVWLARSLGLQARIRAPKSPFYYDEGGVRVQGKPAFTCGITWDGRTRLFRIERKQAKLTKAEDRYQKRWITEIEYSHDEEAMCVTVDAKDSLYLTNDFIVTHNSALVAWIILWAMSTMIDTKGVVTANTEAQLKTKTWPELAKWHRLCLCGHWFEFTATALYSNLPGHEATWRMDQIAWSEARPEAFAGLHNQGKRVLLVFDEASAVADVIWEVAEGALTDEDTEIIWCAFGNPTRAKGRFRDCFGRFGHRWVKRQIDSRTAKMTNKAQMEKWIEDYGLDSDFVKVRVLGQFPSADVSALFNPDTLRESMKRRYTEREISFAPKITGVDVARQGMDDSVFCHRQGLVMFPLEPMHIMDTVLVSQRLAASIEKRGGSHGCFVDATGGYGVGVIDAFRSHGGKCTEVYFSGKATDPRYFNKRSEMYFDLKVWIDNGGALPPDEDLYEELCAIHYEYKGDKLKIVDKEQVRDELGRSPDRADAAALTFAYSVTPPRDPLAALRNASRQRGRGFNYNPLED